MRGESAAGQGTPRQRQRSFVNSERIVHSEKAPSERKRDRSRDVPSREHAARLPSLLPRAAFTRRPVRRCNPSDRQVRRCRRASVPSAHVKNTDGRGFFVNCKVDLVPAVPLAVEE